MTDYLIPDEEGKALEMFWDMKRKFGWSGTFMMRGDFEFFLQRELTDEEWTDVTNHKIWRDVMPSMMAEGGNDVICDLISVLGLPTGDDR